MANGPLKLVTGTLSRLALIFLIGSCILISLMEIADWLGLLLNAFPTPYATKGTIVFDLWLGYHDYNVLPIIFLVNSALVIFLTSGLTKSIKLEDAALMMAYTKEQVYRDVVRIVMVNGARHYLVLLVMTFWMVLLEYKTSDVAELLYGHLEVWFVIPIVFLHTCSLFLFHCFLLLKVSPRFNLAISPVMFIAVVITFLLEISSLNHPLLGLCVAVVFTAFIGGMLVLLDQHETWVDKFWRE